MGDHDSETVPSAAPARAVVACPPVRIPGPRFHREERMSATPGEREAPAGIDADAVTTWLGERVEALQPPLRFELIAGGRSNLTFRVEDGSGRRWVLRRPPLRQVLATAHDMSREHRIVAA